MSTTPNPGRRWALSPIDSRNHLLAEPDDAPVGMLVARCGRVLPCSVDTSPHPPAGLRCPACAWAVSWAWAQFPVRGAYSVPGLSPELVASLALRRACDGGVAKAGDRYVDGGSPTPGYLAGAFDDLINAGLLALAEEDRYGLRRVRVTEAGHARYAQLRDARQRAGLWVPEPRLPTTGPTAVGQRSGTPVPARGGQPDPIRGRGPAMHWVRCPIEGRVHAVEPTDTEQATARGYAQALCGHRLPAEGLAAQHIPSGALCLPCVIGVTTADGDADRRTHRDEDDDGALRPRESGRPT